MSDDQPEISHLLDVDACITMSTRVKRDMRREAAILAQNQGLTLSEWLRNLISEAIQKSQSKAPAGSDSGVFAVLPPSVEGTPQMPIKSKNKEMMSWQTKSVRRK
ncbi:MAG: hypothetical protein NTV88_03590 [Candidatus Micrarchaeota archaeon]|nr:hypothetical protein [Candidatus Micrarchaeota archaeon]